MGTYIARQPIFNKKLNIFGYGLLYRRIAERVPGGLQEDDSETSETITAGFHEIGIERVTGGKRAFVKFTERLLLDDVASLLPSSILVLEFNDPITPTPEVLSACQKLRKRGYLIALNSFALTPEYVSLLSDEDILKVNFSEMPLEKIKVIAASMKGKSIKLLAEQLETKDDFEMAKELGFLLFRGNFFCKPAIMETNKEPAPLKINCMRLIRLAVTPNINFTKVFGIIKNDAVLTYRLLRVVNSAFFRLPYTVQNTRQALAILGMDEVKKWITLISLSKISDDKPDELLRMSLIRARTMELLGPAAGIPPGEADTLFMVGLMSLMDVLMDLPMAEIIQRTKISPAIAEPILTRSGCYGDLLSFIEHYEKSEWDEALALAQRHNITAEQLADAYLEAIDWSKNLSLR